MAAAYRYLAGDGPKPYWLQAHDYVQAFGAASVFGRTLGRSEMSLMIAAGNVRAAYESMTRYRDKDGNENWAEWADRNPELNVILTEAMQKSEDYGA